MAITPEEARQRCIATRKQYATTRRYKDAFWTLQMAYNEGEQWGFITENSNNVTVRQLKGVFDIQGKHRARITINEIQHRTEKADSMTSPQRIKATIKGPCGKTDSYTRSAGKVLEALLTRIGALDHVRQANKDRYTLGSAGIRQTFRLVGQPQMVAPAQGAKPAKTLSKYEIDWAPVMPWEIIRSPRSNTIKMARDEETIGHEKPRTLGWLQEHYNWAPKTETEYSQVAHFLDEIRSAQDARGPGGATLPTDAKEKAVLAEEFWLTDPAETRRIFAETGIRVRWPWIYIGYLDPGQGNGEIQPVHTVGNNGLLRNPFSNLGLHFLHYHVAAEAMWGTGMPWMMMQWQDFSNIAYTWIAESLQQSCSKWRYEKNTIERGKEQKILNNDPSQPIPWERKGQFSLPPDRVAGSPMPQTAAEVAGLAPQGMSRQSGIAPVQQGVGPKRDGSGVALSTLIQEAESVPENRVTTDEGVLAILLRDTTIDTINMSTVGQLRELTGGMVSDSFLLELKRDDARHRIASAEVHPSTMRPKTNQATEARYVGLAKEQFLTPEQAAKEAIRAGITGLDTDREQAYQLQEAEIERMREGQQAQVFRDDEHIWHIECIRRTLNSPERLDFDEEYIEALQSHSLAHQMALEETTGTALGQPEAPMGQPGQGGMASQPANQPAGSMAAGPAGPQLQIA